MILPKNSTVGNCFICGIKFISRYKEDRGFTRTCSHKCGKELARYVRMVRNDIGATRKEFNYVSLHQWIRRRKKMPGKCEDCGKKKILDLANLSGEYKNDVNDWKYLCRACHQKQDGRSARKSNGQFVPKKDR